MTHTNREPADSTDDVFVFPQSRAQRRLWMLAELDPASSAYAIPLALRITGPLDAAALALSLDALVRRHEILRTSYGTIEGKPMQFVHAHRPLALRRESIEPDALAARLAVEAAAPFDLRQPTMLRAALFSIGPAVHVLSLVIHHIACDGWSLDRIVAELDALYAAQTEPDAAEPDEPVLHYSDYANWETEADKTLTGDVDFWTDRLKPVIPLRFASASASPASDGTRPDAGRTTRHVLASDLSGRITQYARGADTTPFTVLLAGFAALLHRASGLTRLSIGTPVANRPRPEFEPMIGFFANTLVLDVDLSGNPDFRTLVERCRDVARETFAHSAAPFDELARRQKREAVDTPLFHALFALQSAPLREPRLGSLGMAVLPVYPCAAKFDLTLMLEPGADALHAALEHRDAVLDAAGADKLLTGFARLLDAMLDEPSLAIGTPALPELPSPAIAAAAAAEQGAAADADATRAELPATPTERTLAELWAALLGRQPMRDDSFFSLGGDSLGALRAAVEARSKGLHLLPAQILGGNSLRTLAAELDRASASGRPAATASTTDRAGAQSDRGTDTPRLGPTPILSWFAQLELAEPDHWAQSLVVESAEPIAAETLRTALRQLANRHPALRQRIALEAGRADVTILPPRDAPDDAGAEAFPLELVQVADEAAARSVVASLAARLDLRQGPLARAALLEQHGKPPRLALAIHHVAVDAVSWSILLQQLAAALAGTDVPPAPAVSLADWHRATATAALAADPAPWLSLVRGGFATLPRLPDALHAPSAGTEAGTRVDSWRLSAAQTARLVGGASTGPRSRGQALLLGALAGALAPLLGSARVALTLEQHGRDADLGIDVTELAGWFTAISPIVLENSHDLPLERLATASRALAALAPRRQEYGLARWLGAGGAARAALDAAGLPEISFNFLGAVGRQASGAFTLRPELIDGERAPGNRRGFALDIVAMIIDDELRMDWRYDATQIDARGIAVAAQAWVAEIAGMLDAIDATPRLAADHPLASLAQREFEALPAAIAQAPLFAHLTPLQEGMLFEAHAHPDSSAFHEQLTAVVEGPLSIPDFLDAWQTMLARHEALRAGFLARADGRPIQFAPSLARIPVTRLDWRDATGADQQEARLARWLADDAARPFDLARPPLMRLAIVTLGEQRHRWIWSFHHILLDGWSIPVFFRELIAIYAGHAATLPAAPRFADHLAWLALRGARAERDAWRERLGGLAPSLLAEPARAPARPSRRDRVLTRATAEAVERLARDSGVTVSAVFDAAWALLLARSGAGTDLAFGVTLSGRSSGAAGADSMIGLFINTLPLRVRLSPGDTVRALLGQVRDGLATLLASEHERLSDILSSAEAGTNALFDTLVVFENYPVEGEFDAVDGLRFARPDYHERTNYPVTLAVIPGDGYTLRLDTDSNRYPDAFAERLLDRLARLIERFAEQPDARLAELAEPMAAAQPAARQAPNPPPLLAHRLFARSASQRPAAPALITPAGTLDYAQLAARARTAAVQLRALGAGPEQVIAMMLPRGANAIAALLGILETGAAYLPIDPNDPASRIEFMLRDAGARVLIAPDGVPAPALDGLAVLDARALFAERDSTSGPAMPVSPDTPEPPPSSLAYVIYTSGSTGKPKGVGVTHAGIENMSRAMRDGFSVDSDSRIFLFPPLTFDASLAEIFTAFACGAALVLPPEGIPQSGTADALLEAARAGRVTHATVPPSLLAALDDTDLPGVRTIVAAGEPAAAGLLAHWAGSRRVVNAYGPSETTVCATMHVCEPAEAMPPIGRAIDGVRVVVLDDWLGIAPVGVPGEIGIGGAALARGYLGRPGLTAASFIPDPEPAEAGARLYRSGDRGVRLADGTIRYLGRSGNMLKLRGYRIDPDGIAGVLQRAPGVREALVDVHAAGRRPELVAYLIARDEVPDGMLDEQALRAHAASQLASHEVPTRFVTVPAWPLGASGKIDRAALRAAWPPLSTSMPDADTTATIRTGQDEADEAGIDRHERQVRDAFRQVLGVPEAGLDDDYFVLGGDSILALQIGAALQRHGVQLHAGEVLELRTARAIAALCRERGAHVVTVAPEPEAAEVPLAPIQQWFLDGGGARPRRFTLDLRLALGSAPRLDALSAALSSVAEHHDAFRLRLRTVDDGTGNSQRRWRQHYAPRNGPLLLPLSVVDTLADERALQGFARELQAGLDPIDGPVARACCVLHGPCGEPELILVAHHLVMDVVSWRNILNELDSAYGAALHRQLTPAPQGLTSFRNWHLALAASAPSREGEHAFWQRMLTPRDGETAEPLGPPGRVGALRTCRLELDAELSARLGGALNRVFDTHVQELLLAALARAWTRWTGQAALRVDIEGHGRQVPAGIDADIARTVGWFTCVYPLRIDPADDWEAAIRQTRDTLRAVPDGGLGYGVLRQAGRLSDAAPRPVGWNYLGSATDGDASHLPTLDARLAAPPLPDGRADDEAVLHPLEVDAAMRGGVLALRFAASLAAGSPAGAAALELPRLMTLMNDALLSLDAWLTARLGALPASPPAGGGPLRPDELDSLLLDLTDTE
ncbi:non-ribosomal peptide synthetase [Burkholderia gladioli]|uniref:non-ribosomal peptide synthetase n=1 Tax=Burkholderia gladioli TaxID=28095 RepID=UPI001641B499|nr:non-ribosomal peptide synthetase [Burkholderia gladioli]